MNPLLSARALDLRFDPAPFLSPGLSALPDLPSPDPLSAIDNVIDWAAQPRRTWIEVAPPCFTALFIASYNIRAELLHEYLACAVQIRSYSHFKQECTRYNSNLR